MLPSRTVYSLTTKGNVFSWLWSAYPNTFVSNRSYLKLICQRQNHPRKWSLKHQSPWRLLPASHDYAASIPAHSWSLSGEAGCFRNESTFYPWSAVFGLHFTVSLHLTPGLLFYWHRPLFECWCIFGAWSVACLVWHVSPELSFNQYRLKSEPD